MGGAMLELGRSSFSSEMDLPLAVKFEVKPLVVSRK